MAYESREMMKFKKYKRMYWLETTKEIVIYFTHLKGKKKRFPYIKEALQKNNEKNFYILLCITSSQRYKGH